MALSKAVKLRRKKNRLRRRAWGNRSIREREKIINSFLRYPTYAEMISEIRNKLMTIPVRITRIKGSMRMTPPSTTLSPVTEKWMKKTLDKLITDNGHRVLGLSDLHFSDFDNEQQ